MFDETGHASYFVAMGTDSGSDLVLAAFEQAGIVGDGPGAFPKFDMYLFLSASISSRILAGDLSYTDAARSLGLLKNAA